MNKYSCFQKGKLSFLICIIFLFLVVSFPSLAQNLSEINNSILYRSINNCNPVIIDFNNDGFLDLITQYYEVKQVQNGVSHLLNRISRWKQVNSNNFEFTFLEDNFNNIYTSRIVPTFYDIDNDGLLDMIVQKDSVQHFEQYATNSDEFILISNNFNSISQKSTAITFTDIDNNKLIDLFIADINGTLSRYEQSSENTYSFSLITHDFSNIRIGKYVTGSDYRT